MTALSTRKLSSTIIDNDPISSKHTPKKLKLNNSLPLPNTSTTTTTMTTNTIQTIQHSSPVVVSPFIDEIPLDIPHCPDSSEFPFGELTQDFVSSTVPGADLQINSFDSFLREVNLNILPVVNESELSSHQNNVNTTTSNACNTNVKRITKNNTATKTEQVSLQKDANQINEVPSSPLSSGGTSKPSDEYTIQGSNSHKSLDSQQKRQADRAARNRESSRRAREKAKNKVRTLESTNLGLTELVRHLKMENQHLMSQLERANILQQSCSMCRYHAALSQQPQVNPQPNPAVLRQ